MRNTQMTAQPAWDGRAPTPEEIRDLMHRAHQARSRAVGDLFRKLLASSKPAVTEPEHANGLRPAACG
jgi:hypothetical protein